MTGVTEWKKWSRDKIGRRYGRLVVLSRSENSGKHATYLCQCDCGNQKKIFGFNLGRHTGSCGCYRDDKLRSTFTTHGFTANRQYDYKYSMLKKAGQRSRRAGIPFNLEMEDIVVPEICPLLGVPLRLGEGKSCPESPTLDKIIPHLGYVKDNVWVVSHRANTIKSDASLEELKTLTANLEKKMKGYVC